MAPAAHLARSTASSSLALHHDQNPSTSTACPDDSDFLESDADGESDSGADSRGEVEMNLSQVYGDGAEDDEEDDELAEDYPSSLRSSRASPSRSTAPRPLRPLIAMTNELSFTYFSHPAPSSAVLNKGKGRASALLPGGKKTGSHGSQITTAPHIDDSNQEYHWFSIDEDLVYLSFFEDWGPLNIAMFYRFCSHLHILMQDAKMRDKKFVLYTSDHPKFKANAALLTALYAMIIDHLQPADVFAPFSEIEFMPFRDAGYGRADFCLTIQDILYGVKRAIECDLLDLTTFNLDEYEHYEQVQNGDWNWITPDFIAFASPNDRDYVAEIRRRTAEGLPLAEDGQLPHDPNRLRRPLSSSFANTIRYFKERGVKLVVRLNNPLYDKAVFEDAGIEHLDLYFDDGSNPSEAILRTFIAAADRVIRAGGAIAVHCKAGLGRTGVLIGAYLVWKHGFSASEVIGFMRIMRPGCVVGPQQHFMYQNFVDWVKWGVQDSALRDARMAVEKERMEWKKSLARMDASKAAATAAMRNMSRKRAVLEADLDTEPTSDGDDEGEDAFGIVNAPVTPKTRRLDDAALLASANPAMKPTPCVGQPRKSPGPQRRRLNGQGQAPATVARMGGHSTYRLQVTRSVSDESLGASNTGASLASAALTATTTAATTTERRSASPPAARTPVDENGPTPTTSPRSSPARQAPSTPTSGRVLGEAQRLNVQAAGGGAEAQQLTPRRRGGGAADDQGTPRASVPLVKTVQSPSQQHVKEAQVTPMTPSARIRSMGHERSRSAVEPISSAVVAPTTPTPSTPQRSPVVGANGHGTPTMPTTPTLEAVGRASPLIKSKYGLKDASSRPAPATTTTTTTSVKTVSSSSRNGTVSASSSASSARSVTTAARTATTTATQHPRPATSMATTRKVSGSGTSTTTMRMRPATSMAQHRDASRTVSGSSSGSEAKSRSGSSSAAGMSRLERPTAASAARAAAAASARAGGSTTGTGSLSHRASLKRPRTVMEPDLATVRPGKVLETTRALQGVTGSRPREGKAGISSRIMPPSSSSSSEREGKIMTGGGIGGGMGRSGSGISGRNVRRRRSSLGEADVDVQA